MNKEDTLSGVLGLLDRTDDFIRNSATVKILSVGILIAFLLIPSSMISSLMRERKLRRDSVVQEISQKWGNRQTITGPFLTVPFKTFYTDEKDNLKFNIHYLHILPENLRISGKIDPEIRYRSIYEAVLYNVQINVDGNFTIPILDHNIDLESVLWEKALFSMGITDMKGIQDNIIIKFVGMFLKNL